MKTEETDKMLAVRKESQLLGEFLEWLFSEKNYSICELDWRTNLHIEEVYFPINKSIEKILADYFKIDLDKVEKEKLKILEEHRKLNEKK